MSKVIKGGSPLSSQKPRQSFAPSPVPMRPKKPIIEKEVVGATHEARRIITEAEAEAQQLIEEARSQVQTIRDHAYQEGREEAVAEYTKRMVEALRAFDGYRAEIEPQYVGLVRVCVEKILGQELKLNPDAVVGIVRNTLRDATQQREINVRVHPADVEILRKNQRRLLDMLARAGSIEIREDQAVRRGGCIVVTEQGTMDASLDRQLAAIEEALKDELEGVLHGRAPASTDGEEAYDEEEGYEEEYEAS